MYVDILLLVLLIVLRDCPCNCDQNLISNLDSLKLRCEVLWLVFTVIATAFAGDYQGEHILR